MSPIAWHQNGAFRAQAPKNSTGAQRIRSGQSRKPLHDNARTSMYLYCLNSGARVVDPGDLDPGTEEAFERLTEVGVLICKRNHGRRIWRRADVMEVQLQRGLTLTWELGEKAGPAPSPESDPAPSLGISHRQATPRREK